jgi:hypothetical protein
VAFLASLATMIASFAAAEALRPKNSNSSSKFNYFIWAACLFFTGFDGVYFGSRCLPQTQRPIGSTFLLFLGISIEVLLFGFAHGEFHFPPAAFPTGFGGLMAVILYFWRTRRDNKAVESPRTSISTL